MQRKRFWRNVGLVVLLLLTVLAALMITGDIEDEAGGTVASADLAGTELVGGGKGIAREVARSPTVTVATSEVTTKPEAEQSATATRPDATIASATSLAGATAAVAATPTTAGADQLAEVTGTIEATGAATPTLRPMLATRTVSSTINGLPQGDFVLIPDDVIQHAAEIFLRGRAMGRDAHRFSVLGDSIADPSAFLTGFDEGQYDLGDYAYLQPVIDYYMGSFVRQGVTVRPGLNMTAVFDPLWADKEICEPDETILDCELRLHNPSVLLILVGTNDAAVTFEERMRPVVQFSIDSGVIPILVTKAFSAGGGNNPRNEILRKIAAEYQIPLWDFGLVADTLPNRGLDADGVHMTLFPEHDYTLSWALASGYGAYNLTALMALDAILQDVVLAAG
jgi:hypothetical protein